MRSWIGLIVRFIAHALVQSLWFLKYCYREVIVLGYKHCSVRIECLLLAKLVIFFALNIAFKNSDANTISVDNSLFNFDSKINFESHRSTFDKSRGLSGASHIQGEYYKGEKKIDGKTESYPGGDLNGIANLRGFSVSQPLYAEQRYMDRASISKFGEIGSSHELENPFNSKSGSTGDFYLYKNLIEDVRVTLSEEVFSKMVWTYFDLKDLDDKVYSTISEYDLKVQSVFGKMQQLIGIDNQINALIIFGANADSGSRNNPSGSANPRGDGDKATLDFSEIGALNAEGQEIGKTGVVFKHFTIKNIAYFLLGVLSVGMVWRGFRFILKQDLSS